MRKINFTSFVFGLLTLFSFQAQAQYSGVAYQSNIPQVGETVGAPVIIELENYDALSSDPNGDGANFNDSNDDIPAGGMGTYYDDSPGGSENGNFLRPNSDVDIEEGGTGAVLGDVRSGEYTIYTINVVTAGTYHMGVNYRHGGSSKDIKVYSHNVDGTGKTLLYNSLPDDGLPPVEYETTDNLGSFALPAGPLLIRFRSLDAGPRFDFFTLTLDTPDGGGEPEGYVGVAFEGNTPQLGVTPGVPVQIECENYDALGAAPNGDGVNFNDNTDDIPTEGMGTYYDDSPGGSADGNPVRATSDVDIKAGGTGNVVSDVKPSEYTIYTVNVVTAGTYYFGLNYKHGGTSKDVKLYTHNADGTGKTLVYDSAPDDGLPQSDYVTTDSLGSFELEEGPLLIRLRTLDSGPSFDFMTFTLAEPVGPVAYAGVAYQGNIPQLGAERAIPVLIECENYDALGADSNGDGANFNDPTDDIPATGMGTYYDNSPGGSADGNSVRATSDVDIKAEGTGNVVSDVKPNEYMVYTVNVVTAGTYYFGLNYKHGGTSKDIKLYTHNADGTGKTLIYDSVPDDGLPQSDYVTTDSLTSFDLEEGPLLIRLRTLDSGPSFDFMTFTLADIIDSTDDAIWRANALKVFPNPASNGVFNVSIEGKWDVYSLSGAKVLEGTGNEVNLSSFPKGVYILKTPFVSRKLISN